MSDVLNNSSAGTEQTAAGSRSKDADGRPSLALVYLASVPLVAAVACFEGAGLGGLNYTGYLWMLYLAVGVLLVLAEGAIHPAATASFPWQPWALWLGYVWLSLIWVDHLEASNVREAVQISMPLLLGIAGSMFVRTTSQLRTLLHAYGWTIVPLTLSLAAIRLGLVHALGMEPAPRVLGLTAALVGCVFLSEIPNRRLVPLLGWAACIALTTLSGSRMATVVLLVVLAIHPLYRHVLTRVAVVGSMLGLAIALFYTPTFQERFFAEGAGTVADVVEGNFLSFGRFETWPGLWDEACRHPVFGGGVGATRQFLPKINPDMTHPHNDYLRIGFEGGLVGLAAFFAVVVWQIADFRRRLAKVSGVRQQVFAAAYLGFFVFLITSFTDNTIVYNLWYMDPLFVLMGAAYGCADGSLAGETEPPHHGDT
jgi:hypothetical protein